MRINATSQSQNYTTPTIDHVLIAVKNLSRAVAEYKEYGFTVVYAGSPKKAFNALIFLSNGTVIELIGKDRLPYLFTFLNKLHITSLFGMMKDRITAFRNVPVGLFNYCLYTENLDTTYQYLKQHGLKVAKPVSFSRHREDMIVIKWQLVGSYPYDLPFFIENYVPDRLSDTAYTIHKNKALSIDSLVIETNSFEKYYNIYNAIYKQIPQVQLNNKLRISTYKISGQCVILQETINVHSVFTKTDQSAPVRFVVKCDKLAGTIPKKVNEFITLTY